VIPPYNTSILHDDLQLRIQAKISSPKEDKGEKGSVQFDYSGIFLRENCCSAVGSDLAQLKKGANQWCERLYTNYSHHASPIRLYGKPVLLQGGLDL
jgi:hypothetical protein